MNLALLSLFTVVALIIVLILVWCVSGYFEPNLSRLKDCLTYRPRYAPRLFQLTVGLQGRSTIELERLPGYLIGLLLLHEDDRFFVHRGFNFPEIRARVLDFIRYRQQLRGGSSISQQFVKPVLYTKLYRIRKILFLFKLREAAATLRLESMYSKEEILQLYLQSVRLGSYHLYGFDAVTRILFNKSLYEIEFQEALFLCGLIPSPTSTSTNIYLTGEYHAYPWGTAFTKTVDLLRMYLITWGREAIYDPSSIRYEDIVKRFKAIAEYSPYGLPPEVELDLEVRAHEIVLRARECFHAVQNKAEEIIEYQRIHYSGQKKSEF